MASKARSSRERIPEPDPESSLPSLGRVLGFLRLLWALDHGLQRTSKQMLAGHGVTGPQRLAIRIVGAFPGISAGALARILLIHPSTLSGILVRLERQRLVERLADPRDKRRALLRLTSRGCAVDARSAGTIESIVQGVLEEVDDARLEAASSLLASLSRALDAGLQNAPISPLRRARGSRPIGR
ncbi:MAG: MarR family transcriptional regulator [Acidobacteria bacterium]|nr:MarR family transcriptional regulator [Acidobacteriota bacterium]